MIAWTPYNPYSLIFVGVYAFFSMIFGFFGMRYFLEWTPVVAGFSAAIITGIVWFMFGFIFTNGG